MQKKKIKINHTMEFFPIFSEVEIPSYKINGIIVGVNLAPSGLTYKVEYIAEGIKDRWFYAQQVVRV